MNYATVKSHTSLNSSSTLERTTPVPNWVLDQALSDLTDSQAKLLLIIARQTNGWADKAGNRKLSDWMSSRFIQDKTGCSESSVSRAIAALITKRLIEVRDGEGNLLLTAAQRRRCKQMHFALKGQPVHNDSAIKTVTDAGLHDSEKQNSHTDEELSDNRFNDKGSEPPLEIQHLEELDKLPQNEELSPKIDDSQNEKSVTREEVHEIKIINDANVTVTNAGLTRTGAGLQSVEATKSFIPNKKTVIHDHTTFTDEGVFNSKSLKNVVKTPSNCGTTKETQTKETLNNNFVDRQNDDPQNDGSSDLPHFEGLGQGLSSETNKAGQPSLSDEARQVLTAYRQQFRECFPDKIIPRATKSDFETLESYFAKHKPQVLISLLSKFFTIDYDFNSRNEYSLHAFVHSVNLLLYGMKRISHFARIRSSDVGSRKAV